MAACARPTPASTAGRDDAGHTAADDPTACTGLGSTGRSTRCPVGPGELRSGPGMASRRWASATRARCPRLLGYWLDGLLVGIVAGLFGAIAGAAASESGTAALIGAIIGLGVSLLYFMAFWTSSGRATPGMRLFHLQIGGAGDGRTLSMGQAAIRWVALGSWIQVLALLPGLGGLLGLLGLAWSVALLVTTVSSPTKQGLHDRFAGSAIVQPIGRDGPVIPCLDPAGPPGRGAAAHGHRRVARRGHAAHRDPVRGRHLHLTLGRR